MHKISSILLDLIAYCLRSAGGRQPVVKSAQNAEEDTGTVACLLNRICRRLMPEEEQELSAKDEIVFDTEPWTWYTPEQMEKYLQEHPERCNRHCGEEK